MSEPQIDRVPGPTTEAAANLAARLRNHGLDYTRSLGAIEREAARAAVEARDRELRAAVEALRGVTLLVEKATGFGGSVIERAAVLRLLDAG